MVLETYHLDVRSSQTRPHRRRRGSRALSGQAAADLLPVVVWLRGPVGQGFPQGECFPLVLWINILIELLPVRLQSNEDKSSPTAPSYSSHDQTRLDSHEIWTCSKSTRAQERVCGQTLVTVMPSCFITLACVAGGLSRWETTSLLLLLVRDYWQNYGAGGGGGRVVKDRGLSTLPGPLPPHRNFVTSPQSPICHQYKMAPVKTAHRIDWDRQLRRLLSPVLTRTIYCVWR